VGEVLFFTLKYVLGEEVYTPEVHFSWVKVFSRILKVMVLQRIFNTVIIRATNNFKYLYFQVPVAVAFEMKVGYELEHGITKTGDDE
jgi:hypothetical protein